MTTLTVSVGSTDDVDRDTWCTSVNWTRRIGRVWLDPCSNERSTVLAERSWRFDLGQDALVLARFLSRRTPGPIYINPPYSRGMVPQFVEAFCRHRFIFLVRADVSTDWWKALWPHVALECRPATRKLFTPPPGVVDTGNVFPHSLLYARAEDATPAVLAASYVTVPQHSRKAA